MVNNNNSLQPAIILKCIIIECNRSFIDINLLLLTYYWNSKCLDHWILIRHLVEGLWPRLASTCTRLWKGFVDYNHSVGPTSFPVKQLSYRMKIYMEFNLKTCPRIIKFMEINTCISKLLFLIFYCKSYHWKIY